MSQSQNVELQQPKHHTPLDWDIKVQLGSVTGVPATLNKVIVKTNAEGMAVSALTFPEVPNSGNQIQGILTNITVPEGFKVISVNENNGKSLDESRAETTQQISMPFLWPHEGELKHIDGHSQQAHLFVKIPRACAMVTFDSLFILKREESEKKIYAFKIKGVQEEIDNLILDSDYPPNIVYEQVPAKYFLLAIMPNATLVYITFESANQVISFINKQHNVWIDTGAIMWEESLGCFLIAYDDRIQNAIATP